MILKTIQGLSGRVRVGWIALAALSLLALLAWHRRGAERRMQQHSKAVDHNPAVALEGDLFKRATVHAGEARRIAEQLARTSALAKAEGAPKIAQLIARWNAP